MSQVNVFQRPQKSLDVGRNAFDRSAKATFSASAGQLIPFFCMEVNPGDHCKLKNQSFTRTRPIHTAAYARFNENIEYFFVSYEQLWSYWNAFYTTVSDENSSVIASTHDVQDDLRDPGFDTLKVPNNVPMMSLFELIKAYGIVSPSGESDIVVNYPNQTNLTTDTDFTGAKLADNFIRLFNMLGYGDLTHRDGRNNLTNNFNYANDYLLNPFRICAYQKIFYDHYRLSNFERNRPMAYNLDYYTRGYSDQSSSYNSNKVASERFKWMWELHYRAAKKDYFTDIQPWVYWFGDGLADIDSSKLVTLPNSIFGVADGTFIGQNIQTDVSSPQQNPLPGVQLNARIGDYPTFQAQAMRMSFALDKYLRLIQLTPKHYDAQIEALFGHKPRNNDKESIRIGGFVNSIQIGEVVSTAETQDGTLGEIVGKGTSALDSGTLEFTADKHGIVMGIYSVSPLQEYNSFGVDPFNQKMVRTDYYNPAFDNIGPHILRRMSNFFVFGSNALNNRIMGFVKPWLEYKSNVDKVYNEFVTGGYDNIWSVPRKVIYGAASDQFRSADWLRVNPHDYDNIFAMTYNGQAHRDQFLINCQTSAMNVSAMSVHGEP